MREQEVKFKFNGAYSYLLQNVTILADHMIVDTYYDVENDSLLKSDRVLRVRQMDNEFFLAYKDKRKTLSSRVIDREEIEMNVENEKIHAILQGLGYHKRDILEKRRTIIRDLAFPDLKINKDTYPFIGDYWEVEGEENRIQSYLDYYSINSDSLELLNCTEIFIKYCVDKELNFSIDMRLAQTFDNEREYYADKHV